MKIYLITFLLFSSFSSLTAQNKADLNKIWISPYLEYLDLRQNDTAYFDYGMGYHERYQLEKEDSVFKLIQYDRIAGVKEPWKVVKSYKIIKLTSDTLLIHPLTKYSKVFIENKDKSYAAKFHSDPSNVDLNENDVYTFVDKSILYDSDLKFDRLYFRSTPCYGSCPSMEFEIDSLGNLKFIGQMNTGKYKGNYYGTLASKQFDILIEILKSSALDYIPENLGGGIDAPDYNLIISYNGKIKTITGGHAYPYFNRPLFDYLLTIFENVKLKKTKEIEFTLTTMKNKSPNR
jgi:hypothetical protein